MSSYSFTESLNKLSKNKKRKQNEILNDLRKVFLETGDGLRKSDGTRETWMKFTVLKDFVDTKIFNNQLLDLSNEFSSSEDPHKMWLSTIINISLKNTYYS